MYHFLFIWLLVCHCSSAVESRVEPYLHLSQLIHSNLIIINVEVSGHCGQLVKSMDSSVIEMEKARIGHVFDVR
jgi:hypothetical protein